mgnify:CR=1 FL=1|tara:strand:+ start:1105 stop:1338 length:234 start_codon:yes stop_codon:yes gene_type:complete
MPDDKKVISNDYEDFTEMVKDHRSVFKSLINKDGYYKTGEAVEINNAFGKQLNYLKIVLESYKILGVKPKKKDLFLK